MTVNEDAPDEGKKRKGGVYVPEEWPWEKAKKLFETPDVIPSDQVEVRLVTRNRNYEIHACTL